MARQLWLLRHAEAEPHDARADFDRRLTERGEEQARAAGRAIARLQPAFGAVFTSPRRRASATAELVAAHWGEQPQVLATLSQGFDASAALEALAGFADGERILLVGHEPDFSNTVAELTGARIDLKKSGLAVVRLEGGGAELLALWRPREIANMAQPA